MTNKLMNKIIVVSLLAFFSLFGNNVLACSNFIITKGASIDGSTMLSYTADAGGFMEPLYIHEGGQHKADDSVAIYEWDSGWTKYLGKIKQAPITYRVIGNMNEWQLTIGETTFGGRPELVDTTAIMDYGSLIYITLQRARTAREAITIMTDLAEEYGYYSSGESISIVDPNEAWILEIISKGKKEKGAVWVAKRVPDGHIAAHANKSRIRELSENKDECIYSKDVISFAEQMGYYDRKSGKPFSFADAYDPEEPSNLFACEGRVWVIYKKAAPSLNLSADYFRAVKGAEPYPFSIKPDKKLGVKDVANIMRDHFENTEFDMTKGTAAGPFGCPYRWKPLGFKIEGDSNSYDWERPLSTQQTAFSFISQARSYMPREVGGVFWYGVDDNYSTVYTPLYCSITKAPECFLNADIANFNLNSAAWMFNLVANLAYQKYSYVIKDIQKEQSALEDKYLTYQTAIEKAAVELINTNRELGIEYLTEYSNSQAKNTMTKWTELWKQLVMKYNDGYINDVTKDKGRSPKGVGYGNDFFKQVVKERPGYYEMKWRNPIKSNKKKK